MKKTANLFFFFLAFILMFVSCSNAVVDTDETQTTGIESSSDTLINTDGDEKYDQLKRKIAADWSIYLVHKESMCRDMYWMLDYVAAFYDSPSIETLLKARTALDVLIRELEILEFPEYSVTSEQHAELIAAGCDITGFWAELNSLESVRAEFLSDCKLIDSYLYYDVFFTPLQDCSKEHILNVRESVGITVDLMAAYTDSLMFSMNIDSIKRDFMAYLVENKLLITSYLPEFSEDLETIYKKTDKAIDDMTDNVDAFNIIVGKKKVAVDDMIELMKNNDTEKINEIKLKLKSDEAMLPLPDFYEAGKASFGYYFENDSETVTVADIGEPIAVIPDKCQAIFGEVSEIDYKEYVVKLIEYGVSLQDVENIDGKYTALLKVDESYFMIKYENENNVSHYK